MVQPDGSGLVDIDQPIAVHVDPAALGLIREGLTRAPERAQEDGVGKPLTDALEEGDVGGLLRGGSRVENGVREAVSVDVAGGLDHHRRVWLWRRKYGVAVGPAGQALRSPAEDPFVRWARGDIAIVR